MTQSKLFASCPVQNNNIQNGTLKIHSLKVSAHLTCCIQTTYAKACAHELNSRPACTHRRAPPPQCIVLNGVLFIGSIALLHFGLVPLLHGAGALLLRSAGASPEATALAHRAVRSAVGALFQALWVAPLYLISLLMNTIWYGRIADAAFELHHGARVSADVHTTIKEGVYRVLVLLFYLVESALAFQLLPVVGTAVGTLLVCWVNALYSFESVWTMQGLDLKQRLALIERCAIEWCSCAVHTCALR
jgi:Etoposide-induced protein 2.4 (EI24)